MSEKHPRGLRGASHGAAGPVKHVDPTTIEVAPPPAVDPRYLTYCAWCRDNGRTPKPLHKWRYKAMKRRARREETPQAVKQHMFRPYTPN